eukprot:jgi/Bigna1/126391/aug1.2_g1099
MTEGGWRRVNTYSATCLAEIFRFGSTQTSNYSRFPQHLISPVTVLTWYDTSNQGDPDRDCLVLLRRGYMRLNQTDLSNVTAVATVRHPVRRFISGYGTVMHRSRSYKQIFQADGDMGVDIMAPYIIDSNGSHTLTNALQVDTLLHLMSQMLFLSRYPGKVHYLGQTENMKESISFVKKELLGLENIDDDDDDDDDDKEESSEEGKWRRCPDTEVRRNNVHESSGDMWSSDRYLEEREAIDKLNRFFREEMEILGYDPL